MERNVGPEDRVVRIVVGIALLAVIYLVHVSQIAEIIVGVLAAYLILTGLFVRCPFYKMIDVDTNIQEQPYSTTDDRAGF